jgi:hypothetical protein
VERRKPTAAEVVAAAPRGTGNLPAAPFPAADWGATLRPWAKKRRATRHAAPIPADLKLGKRQNLLRLGEFVMRHPRSRAWARFIACAAALVAAASGFAPGAIAQQHFNHLFVFGDSYADLTLSDKPASNPLAPPGFNLPAWRVYPLSLAANLGIKGGQIADIAVGGATASPKIGPPGIPPFLDLPQQVGAFLATNPPFGPNDLITLNIGGNDIREIFRNTVFGKPADNLAAGYINDTLKGDNAKTFADQTVNYAIGTTGVPGIADLVKAGGRNFVLGEFSTISGLPELQDTLKLAVAGG